jgi:hypothetical protein
VAISRLAIRACLQRRVRIAATSDGEQASGKVGEVGEEGRRQVIGHV